jgi:hypothetical protein
MAQPTPPPTPGKSSSNLDRLKFGLDIAGIFDPTGLADLGSAGISVYQGVSKAAKGEEGAGGHFVDAGISLVSMLPFGDVAKLGKLRHVPKVQEAAAKLGQKAPKLQEAASKFGAKAGQAGDAIGAKFPQAKRWLDDLLQGGAGGAGAHASGDAAKASKTHRADGLKFDIHEPQAKGARGRLQQAFESAKTVFDTPHVTPRQVTDAESRWQKAAEAAKKLYGGDPEKFDYDKAEAARKAVSEAFAEMQRLKELMGKRSGLKDQAAGFAAEGLKSRLSAGPGRGEGLFGFLGRTALGGATDYASFAGAEKIFGKGAPDEIKRKTADLARPYVQAAGTTAARVAGTAAVSAGYYGLSRLAHRAPQQQQEQGGRRGFTPNWLGRKLGLGGGGGSKASGGSFGGGGQFVAGKPTQITVGDAPDPELVTVTPLGRKGMTSVGPGGAKFAGGGSIFSPGGGNRVTNNPLFKRLTSPRLKGPLGSYDMGEMTRENRQRAFGAMKGTVAAAGSALGIDASGPGIAGHGGTFSGTPEGQAMSDVAATLKKIVEPGKSLTERFKALAESVVKLPAAITDWSKSLLESQRRLAQVSGPQAMIHARRDVRQIQRDVASGRATAGSTDRLAEAMDDLMDDLRPLKDEVRNLANNVLVPMLRTLNVLVSTTKAMAKASIGDFGGATKEMRDLARDLAGVDERAGFNAFNDFLTDVRGREKDKDKRGGGVPPR